MNNNDFRRYVETLTFHPDDLPDFGTWEAAELFEEILGEFGWTQDGDLAFSWGDSSTPTTWAVGLSPLGQIDVVELDAAGEVTRTSFKGSDWRVITRRALMFLADNSSASGKGVIPASAGHAPMF